MSNNYPDKYVLFNSQQSKNLSAVFTVEGIDTSFSVADIYTTVRYGDTDAVYGVEGLVYGGLRKILNNNAWVLIDSGLTISQRIEPEQGRGNVGTITISLLDKNGEMAALVSPGITLDEFLGSKEVRVYLGYTQTSFPEDYFLAFRGYATKVRAPHTKIEIELSDPTFKKRQPLFQTTQSSLTSSINNSVTTIPIANTAGFYEHILGPDSIYDNAVRTYLHCEDEYMEYGAGDVSASSVVVERGGSHSLGTTPASHDSGASIDSVIQIEDNAVTIALKLMLSGWNGPFVSGLSVQDIGYSVDPSILFRNDIFVLSAGDADLDYGLTPGDWFTITESGVAGNNVTGQVVGFLDQAGSKNRIIITDKVFTAETPSTATVSFRSKYDTLPVLSGLKMSPRDVDVSGIESTRDTYFISSSKMRFVWQEATAGKEIIDTQILLPLGAYSVTRFGRSSISVTKPPLAGETLPIFDETNVTEPQNILVERAINSRRFFDLVTYDYDLFPNGTYATSQQNIDTTSLNSFGVVTKLPIEAPGVRTDLGGGGTS